MQLHKHHDGYLRKHFATAAYAVSLCDGPEHSCNDM